MVSFFKLPRANAWGGAGPGGPPVPKRAGENFTADNDGRKQPRAA